MFMANYLLVKVLGVIPARYSSTRLPGKPLEMIGDKTMIQRVYEQASKANFDAICVATDDQRIFEHVNSFGKVTLTSKTHQSGTDRCAEVVSIKEYLEYDYIINIQGDEPFINPDQINTLIALLSSGICSIGTLISPSSDAEAIQSRNTAKVTVNLAGKALYFSRSVIPYNAKEAYLHIGMYGYQRDTLLELAKLPISELEKTESLEQLRWIENGYAIHTAISDHESLSVDTPADLQKARKMTQ
jgi:3-deoxy-manno-octulosonate cytidylyltransferase (CMP-KDO synthetase)